MHEPVGYLRGPDLAASSNPEKQKTYLSRLKHAGRIMASTLMLAGGMLFLESDQYQPDQIFVNHEEAPPLPDEVAVMTANVHSWRQPEGNNLERFYSITDMGRDRYGNFDTFAEVVEEVRPNIICLQEVVADGPELARLHGMGYSIFFDTTRRYPGRERFGNAVAISSSIIETASLALPTPNTSTARNAVIAYATTESDSVIRVVNTHFSTDSNESELQDRYLVNRLENWRSIFCGDFNAELHELSTFPLGTISNDTSIASLGIATYPASRADRAIDNVALSCGFNDSGEHILAKGSILEASVRYIGSDHLALVVLIDLNKCDESAIGIKYNLPSDISSILSDLVIIVPIRNGQPR